MCIFASELAHFGRVGLALCAIGNHLHIEIMRQRNERAQNDRPRALGIGARHHAVNLDEINLEALQLRQG